MRAPRVPTYRKHPNGQAFVEHRSIPTPSRRIYLGKYGTPESRKRYNEVIAQILTAPEIPPPVAASKVVTIDELCLVYMHHASSYYGAKSTEYHHIKTAINDLSRMFGTMHGCDFGPRALTTLRQSWVSANRSRTQCNRFTGLVKRMFRWVSQQEFVPPETWQKLVCVEGLKAGKTAARETVKVKSVPRQHVDNLLPFLSPTVAAMVQVQYLCGMRPQDICNMRGCNLEQGGPVWLYRVPKHKTAWRGHELVKAIPLRAQTLLTPFLRDDPSEHLFSPKRAEELRIGKTAKRKSRQLRDYYDTHSYHGAIKNGFEKAKRAGLELAKWHPNQLRHLIATEISQAIGEQAAQRWLGHAHLQTTSIYTEKQVKELISIAQELERHWATVSA